MSKVKRNLLLLLACIFLFSAVALVFTACSTPSYTVTFLVQNDSTGEWEQYATASSDDGSVTLPNNPSKTSYVFRNWYDNTDFTGEPFTGENVESDMNVYAYFVPTEISINVTKSADEVDEDTVYVRDLEALKEQYEQEALDMNLTFDGWYTGADYDTLWTTSSSVDTVYGRFMAQITYDNGFETYEPFTVQAGTTISRPTLEYIQKSYMDDDDIYYVVGDAEDYLNYNEDGILVGYNEFDFSQPVSQNTTITVLWKTPYLDYNVNANGTYTVIGFAYSINGTSLDNNSALQAELQSFPVISLPAYVSACDSDCTGNNGFFTTAGAVESVFTNTYLDYCYLDSLQKVIVQEGIKWINGIYGSSTVEEVVLPSTLKGLERALNGLVNLKSLTIPDGVEVIINSLFYYRSPDVTYNTNHDGYDFEIEIPASVKNMALVPTTNLTFAEGSPFFIEDKALYLQKDEDDLILINSFNVVDGELHVKEGVTGIQTAAFFYNASAADYVYLPASFYYINTNTLHTDYLYAVSYAATRVNSSGNPSSQSGSSSYLDSTGFVSTGVATQRHTSNNLLFRRLGSDSTYYTLQKFIFAGAEYPSSLPDEAFSDSSGNSWRAYIGTENYVVFTGVKEEGESIDIYISATNTSVAQTTYITIEGVSGESLTEDMVKRYIIDKELTDQIDLISVTQFGDAFSLPATLSSNVYLEIEYEYTVSGFAWEVDPETGEAIVTGLDTSTALRLDSGYYFVIITSTVIDESGVAHPVTAIKDKAFYEDIRIGSLIISNGVKYIGESAFEGCTNLTAVTIQSGGLEEIASYAFANTGFETITLPLAKVTYIGPYAFKSESLRYFTLAEGETAIVMGSSDEASTPMEVGKYYLFSGLGGQGSLYTIIRYTGSDSAMSATYSDRENKTVEVTIYDVQLVAIAAGGSFSNLNLGASERGYATPTSVKQVIYRYEVMEGSVYYLNNTTGIVFGAVSKIHKNAFTDINDNFTTMSGGVYINSVYLYEKTRATTDIYDNWLTMEQVSGISSKDYDFNAADAIFEDGWWEGISVRDENYEEIMGFMSADYMGNSDTDLSYYTLVMSGRN